MPYHLLLLLLEEPLSPIARITNLKRAIMTEVSSVEELTHAIGENIRSLRLQKNLTQQTLAAQAGASLSALRHLESGQGANLSTLIRVVRALDRQAWLQALAPQVTINPLHMTPTLGTRQRARARRNQRAHGQAS